jgi:hypothetical protein
LSRHRYAGFLTRPHIGSGWHRSTNMPFDCQSNLRRGFWHVSVQVRGNDDPAAFVDCAQRRMLVCSHTLAAQGLTCSNWRWENGRRVSHLGLLDARTHARTHARTCVPCRPSRLQHVARDVSDARCSWSRRKDLPAHADSVPSPCISRHWTVLYYTPSASTKNQL